MPGRGRNVTKAGAQWKARRWASLWGMSSRPPGPPPENPFTLGNQGLREHLWCKKMHLGQDSPKNCCSPASRCKHTQPQHPYSKQFQARLSVRAKVQSQEPQCPHSSHHLDGLFLRPCGTQQHIWHTVWVSINTQQ